MAQRPYTRVRNVKAAGLRTGRTSASSNQDNGQSDSAALAALRLRYGEVVRLDASAFIGPDPIKLAPTGLLARSTHIRG